LQQKNSCFCNCLSFHLHQDFLSFSTYHLWLRRDPFHCVSIKTSLSHSVHLWQTQDPYLSISISTIVAKIRSIISFQLHQDIFSHSEQLCKDKDL
jgi:hypothetical protein